MNVMDEYIKTTKTNIKEYTELVFDKQFEEDIFEEYIEMYINIRYYNISEDEAHPQLKNKILRALNVKKEKLIINDPEREKNIENMCEFYNYILYLDNVIVSRNIEKVVEDISEFRIYRIDMENEQYKEMFKERILKMILANQKYIRNFFKTFETDEFFLKLSYYPSITSVQRVNLKYNFEISLYSVSAIEKAINKGNVSEDKLFVEYYLITHQIIKDIIRGNFNKQYIIEFVETLFKKKQKINKLFDIIRNVAIQDKLSLKIRYNTFLENKDKIYELMRTGFRIAIVLDEKYEFSLEEFEKLNIFKFILVNKSSSYYDKIKNNKHILKDKIIEL